MKDAVRRFLEDPAIASVMSDQLGPLLIKCFLTGVWEEPSDAELWASIETSMRAHGLLPAEEEPLATHTT